MSFEVCLTHEAEKVLDRIDRPTEERIRHRFHQLAVDPFDPRLSGALTDRPGIRKSRVGGWRILYTVDREAKLLFVITVDTRGQVYRR